MIIKALIVGLGGFIGSSFRYLVGIAARPLVLNHWFPLGTFLVNIIGCLLIGLVAGLVEAKHISSETTTLFLTAGILGGFTTFSAFGLETMSLAKYTHSGAALINILAQVIFGLLAAWGGHHMGRSIF